MPENNHSPTVRLYTLGCKVNFCDSSALAHALERCGFTRARNGASADAEVVNTCAVTARSMQKARQLVSRIRSANPAGFILAVGCGVRAPDAARRPALRADAEAPTLEAAAEILCRRWGLAPPEVVSHGLDPARTRAFIKVQDGCDAGCAYCIVPLVRPRPQSLTRAEAVRRVEDALANGHHEIVLCGTHLGRYGRDTGNGSLAALIRCIERLGGRFRIRLSSVEPLDVSDELLEAMGSSERICPHLHIPLQSGSDRILKAMRRPYDAAGFVATLKRARAALKDPAVTTDIMTGFPGESAQDHRQTVELARAAGFARAHVFVFSPRPGTSAATLAGRVGKREAAERSAEIREVCATSAGEFRKGLVGGIAEVLGETVRDGRVEGFCRRYQRVTFPAGKRSLGTLTRLYIIGEAEGGVLEGTPVERGH